MGGRSVKISNLSGERVVIFPVIFWRELRGEFQKVYGAGADSLIAHMAEVYGKSVGEHVLKMGKGSEEWARLFEEVTAESGWGELRIEGDSEKGDRFVLELSSCAFCEVKQGNDRCRCDLVRWTAIGVAQELYKKGFSGNEQECVSRGGKTCRFEIFARERKNELPWRVKAYFPWLDQG